MPRVLPDPIPWLAGVSLVGVLLLGGALRLQLAGVSLDGLAFWHLRSAHSHLAWYGLVFPLVWLAWRGTGVGGVRPVWAWIYGAATVLATLAFAWSGYNPISIAASTVVLLVWLGWSLPLLPRLIRNDWAGIAGPSVLAAATAIPAVAVLSKRGDPMAPELVQAFLAWLLLGVALPAALHRLRTPAPPAWVAAPLVLAAGAAVGPWPVLPARVALLILGAGIVVLAAMTRASRIERAALALVGVGLSLLAVRVLPDTHYVAIAGLHFAALGPIAFTLAWPTDRERWAVPYLTAVSAFAASIAVMTWWPDPGWLTAAAALGFVILSMWGLAAGTRLSSTCFTQRRLPKEVP